MPPESIVLLVLLAGLFFLMVNRTRRQQRDSQNLQANLTVGTRIMTTAGLFATVVAVDDTTVTLETAPGQRSRWDRRAVARIAPELPEEPVAAEGGTDPVEGGAEADGDVGEPLGRETTQGGASSAAAPSQDTAPPDRP